MKATFFFRKNLTADPKTLNFQYWALKLAKQTCWIKNWILNQCAAYEKYQFGNFKQLVDYQKVQFELRYSFVISHHYRLFISGMQ